MKYDKFDDGRRPSPRTLYRAKRGGIIFGVFAGIADYFGLQRGPTQLVGAVICFAMPIFFICYFILGFILKKEPDGLYSSPDTEHMWRSYRRSPVGTVAELRHRFRNIDNRLQKMERYVTSSRYQLDDDFKNL